MRDCPTCERAFKKIDDYPLIYVVKFEKKDIPIDLKFPIKRGWGDYVNPDSNFGNPKAPEEVVGFFKKNEDVDKFDYQGWTWNRGSIHDGDTFYYRSQDNGRDLVFSFVEPYIEKLESLVGQQVPTSEVTPSFSETEKGIYGIPETCYYFQIREYEESMDRNDNGADDLQGMNQQGLRRVSLEFIEYGAALMPLPPPIKTLAIVGTLTYEGRVKDHKR